MLRTYCVSNDYKQPGTKQLQLNKACHIQLVYPLLGKKGNKESVTNGLVVLA